jgi:hypothetical protein
MAGEQLRLAIQALRANWLRGVLTALGVIIGRRPRPTCADWGRTSSCSTGSS